MEITVRTGQIPPIKKSRQGEELPAYFGPSKPHAHWFRQLRRLQAYCRLVDRPEMTPAQLIQQRELWQAVRQAAGFGGSFTHWWSLHGIGLPGAPSSVPDFPPAMRKLTPSLIVSGHVFETWNTS